MGVIKAYGADSDNDTHDIVPGAALRAEHQIQHDARCNNNSDWTMVELTPWSQITKGSLKLAKVIAVIGAATIMLTLVMLLSRQFTKPIKRLVGAMNRYSVEGQNVKLPEDYRNEFGYLFAGYRNT